MRMMIPKSSRGIQALFSNPAHLRGVPSSPGPQRMKSFRHITWNVDGLNEKNLKVRIKGVCQLVIREEAVFVFLQEVTEAVEAIVREKLGQFFHMFSGNDNVTNYYTLTLISKKVPAVRVVSSEVISFRRTDMGRNLLKTEVCARALHPPVWA